MESFLSTNCEYYPRLIRIFYSNLELLKGGFRTEVKGKKIQMTYSEFSKHTGLPFYGANIDGRVTDDSTEDAWEHDLVRATAVSAIMEEGFIERNSLPVGQMKVQHRLLLYVITKILVPRLHNFSTVQQIDINLLWGMIYDLPMSWTWIVVTTMHQASETSKSALPYPQLITSLLRKFKVSLANEEKITRTSLIGEAIINQMGIKYVNGAWVWAKAPNTPVEEDAATQVANNILQTLQEFIASQQVHNAQVSTALADLQERMKAVEKHFSVQISFEDIAQVGTEAAQEADQTKEPEENPVEPVASLNPLGEETPTETNTVVSTSSIGDKED